MGHGETVPPEIAKTLVGWKKHFNSFTQRGRLNLVLSAYASTAFITLYFVYGRGGKKQVEAVPARNKK